MVGGEKRRVNLTLPVGVLEAARALVGERGVSGLVGGLLSVALGVEPVGDGGRQAVRDAELLLSTSGAVFSPDGAVEASERAGSFTDVSKIGGNVLLLLTPPPPPKAKRETVLDPLPALAGAVSSPPADQPARSRYPFLDPPPLAERGPGWGAFPPSRPSPGALDAIAEEERAKRKE